MYGGITDFPYCGEGIVSKLCNIIILSCVHKGQYQVTLIASPILMVNFKSGKVFIFKHYEDIDIY